MDKMREIREYSLGKQDISKYKKILEQGFEVRSFGVDINWNPPKMKRVRRRFIVRLLGKKRRHYGFKKYINKRKRK